MSPRRTTKAKTPRRKTRRAAAVPRRGRLRLLGTAAAVLTAALAGVFLYLQVAVSSRFEGRLWASPSRIYSAWLELTAGDGVSVTALEERLKRSGYARVGATPDRPGTYRSGADRLVVYLRPLSAPGAQEEARLRDIRLSDGRVDSIRDGAGRRAPRAVFEPEVLATLYGSRQEERALVQLPEVPERFLHAILAAEDARFFRHHGIDLRGIIRAAFANVRSRRIVQGGSTITQQTVKNLYLDQDRTWWRKIREALMSVVLDANYDKQRILEVYLNEVYLGQRGPVAICGVQAAARFYFGRDLDHLTLGEWALLAGMIRSPGGHNPFQHPDGAMARRDQVLAALDRLGWATPEEVAAARAEPLRLASGSGGYNQARHAVDFVQAKLAEDFPADVLLTGGLKIYTTLDTRVQESAVLALARGLERLERDMPSVRKQLSSRSLQGAVVVTRPGTGEILGLVGGRDYGASQFNRAVAARRQPGSCFKPFVIAAGFEHARDGKPGGLTPASLLEDEPLEMVSGGLTWRPANYDREYRGMVTTRLAVEKSLNVPMVRAALAMGLPAVADMARRCGIASPLKPLPSLALGTAEVTPLELAVAYGTLAHQGHYRAPWIVRAVMDADGNPLAGRAAEGHQALPPEVAYLVTDVMRGVFDDGTARSAAELGFHGNAAGKTGTTDDKRDSWFVGYTPDLLGLVWVGYDDNARTGLTGASGALPIWVDLMRQSGFASRRRAFPVPDGIVRLMVDPETSGLATPGCPEREVERFIAGTEPEDCELHGRRYRHWWHRFTRKGQRPTI